ncbi:MAG: hypothetical protein Q4A37_00395 [Candidatus Saccharibacteria bacterium]|nr:hypothetical protein [Candidatus Saccharibacteria bacterium]
MNRHKGIIIPLLFLLSLAIGAILLYVRGQRLVQKGLKQALTKERHELILVWLRRITVVLVVLFVIVFAMLEVSGFGGQIRFYTKWIECGRKPLQSGLLFKNIAYYEQSPSVNFLRFSPDYFCSEREAELKGYSARSLSHYYPHLTEEERQKQMTLPGYDE